VVGVIVPVVLGLCMQLYTFLNAWDTVRHVLLGFTMSAWRGFLDSPPTHCRWRAAWSWQLSIS